MLTERLREHHVLPDTEREIVAHPVSYLPEILGTSSSGGPRMNETTNNQMRLRQIVMDGLIALGIALLISAELPF